MTLTLLGLISTVTGFTSFGLGLAVQVTVKSRPGAGSTFGFWIPLRGSEAAPGA